MDTALDVQLKKGRPTNKEDLLWKIELQIIIFRLSALYIYHWLDLFIYKILYKETTSIFTLDQNFPLGLLFFICIALKSQNMFCSFSYVVLDHLLRFSLMVILHPSS